MAGRGRHLWRLSSSTGQWEKICLGPFGWILNMSKDVESATSLDNLWQCFFTPTLRVFSNSYMAFPVFQWVPSSSCPVAGHHREVSGFCLPYFSHQSFTHMDKIPLNLLLSRLSNPSTVILSSYKSSSSLIPFMSLHWMCSSMSITLSHIQESRADLAFTESQTQLSGKRPLRS